MKSMFAPVFVVASILIAGCSFFTGSSSVITLNLGDAQAQAQTKALKPLAVLDYSLTITGSGMNQIVKTLPANTYTVTLFVPAGPARSFELDVNLDTTSQFFSGSVLSYRGTEVTDLAPGEKKLLNLRMIPGETMLLVPDTYGNRVAQLDSFSTAVPLIQLDLSVLGAIDSANWPPTAPANIFSPSDVDMDGKGRIYIANYNLSGTAAYNRIIRVDNIGGTGLTEFPPTGSFAGGVHSIAVDKLNNYLYFFYASAKDPYSFWRADLNAPPAANYLNINLQSEIPGTFILAFGMDVDAQGFVYMTCALNTTPVYYILKIDPNRPQGSRVVKIYSDNTVLNLPFDIVVKGDFLFVTNYQGATAYRILKLRRSDLGLEAHGGTIIPITGATGIPGEFFAPERFMSTTSKHIILSDEGTFGMVTVSYANRLIEFDDIDFSNWGIRGSDGFKFYDAN